MINQLEVSTETIEDLNKYMDLQQKLNEVELSLKRMTESLEDGTIHGGEPFTQIKTLKSIRIVEERRQEILDLMREVHDHITEACMPKSVDIGDRWISAGNGFYFKLKEGKVIIADVKF